MARLNYEDVMPVLTKECPSCGADLRSKETGNGGIWATCEAGCAPVIIFGAWRDLLYRRNWEDDPERCTSCGFILVDGACRQGECPGNEEPEECENCGAPIILPDGTCVDNTCASYGGLSSFEPYNGDVEVNEPDIIVFDEALAAIEIIRTPDKNGWYKGLCPSCGTHEFGFKLGRARSAIVHCFKGCLGAEVFNAIRNSRSKRMLGR